MDTTLRFRNALVADLSAADRILSKNPSLLDHPAFGKSETALHFFSVENRHDLVAWLLSRGANPNGISTSDFPLHGAAQLGHHEVCKVLLDGGANPNSTDANGETALHKASCGGYLDIIKTLLASGADPTLADMCGELPIDQALPRKREQIRAIFNRYAKA